MFFFLLYILSQAVPLYIQKAKNKKSRSLRDFIFCLLGIIPQTPRTKISSLRYAPYGAIFPFFPYCENGQFCQLQYRVYIHNFVYAKAFL